MTLGRRIEERRKAFGISQAELARRVGVRQSTMNSLINGDSRSSRSIVQLARELRTTAAYLTGVTDDPDEGAPPPPPTAPVQYVTLPVALPSEEAMADAFEGLLLASPRLAGAELARELAKRLPTLLRVAAGALAAPASVDPAVPDEAEEAPADDRRERRRASRR